MLLKLCFLGFFAIALGQAVQEKENLDQLISDVFDKKEDEGRSLLTNKPCNGGLGECVPYHLCNNGTINTDGTGLINVRFYEECVALTEQCCALVPPPPILIEPSAGGCGLRSTEGVGSRITGNSDGESEYGEFPWMVAILKKILVNDQVMHIYQCGGSLILPNVVLTAAHCVKGKNSQTLTVRAGEWDTQTENEIFPHSDHDVADLVIHKDFYKGGLYNDIALLFLKDPVPYEEHINNVCLPPQDTPFDHNRCFVSGWGKDVFGKEGEYQVILKKIELPVVPFEPCQQSLRRSVRLGNEFKLHNSFLCAGGEPGKDTCKGDGGSPLVCPVPGKPGHYYQAGIVAWGLGCGESGTPGVYVNVARFRTWIDQQVSSRGIESSKYIL